ncbi:MAG TPA: hypothetical protein VNJ12_06905 [Candidatus Dormibacteraeota bacterium]|nr:hypothetical protein [Candidatus Dormibacteraeota bacterium]
MRKVQSIALILSLLLAPLALVANSASMARYEQQLRMMAHDDYCAHAAPLGICGCYPGNAPAPIVISPLPEMLLSRPVSTPLLQIRPQARPAPDLIFPAGFSSVTFHPPRG